MHYIIQENIFKEHHYNILQDTLDRLGLEYTIVRAFAFTDKVVGLEDIPTNNDFDVDDLPDFDPGTKDVFVFGALKLARVAKLKGWIPGVLMTDNHDFNIYKDYYRENLLNYDSQIIKISDKINWNNDEKFIRPTQDTKSFTGAVFTEEMWRDTLEHYLHNYKSEVFNENTEIQVSTVKEIYKEIRFWVVDGKIITGSQYRLGNKTIYSEVVEQEAIDFAQEMVNIFQLAEAFVIDVCLTKDGWKIVECGCINCAGFYKSDVAKMVMSIDIYYTFKQWQEDKKLEIKKSEEETRQALYNITYKRMELAIANSMRELHNRVDERGHLISILPKDYKNG